MQDNGKTPNRLIRESSPYLLQHAYNPVDWRPWGNEAFQEARETDRPILVSIGYAACHWCHVMERESFEDEAVAALMNRNFICVKVDREEYPAVDDIYMEAVQAIAGNGGWPLNCFLTPEGKPFYGGTYFPPKDYSGRPGWTTVLNYISGLYQNERAQVEEQADKLTRHIGSDPAFLKLNPAPPSDVGPKAFLNLYQKFDHQRGGFEGAPKFPASYALRFLLAAQPFGKSNAQADEMIITSLDRMAAGGFYDQAGGGFHRYTVDAAWKIPHFEKMLYDNAALLTLYAEGWVKYQKPHWKNLIYQTAAFLLREMQDPATGAFYAALDADSEGVEGKFYTWSQQEIHTILGPEAEAFCQRFGVEPQGNWEGTNILIRTNGFGEDQGPEARWFARLLEARDQRIRPLTDTKTLTSWNGLMLHAWAQIWKYFPEPEWKAAALRLGEYLIADRIRPQGLVHTTGGIPATLEDYAFLIRGLLEGAWLWDKPEWMEAALALLQETDLLMLDPADNYYFSAPAHALGLIVRKKDFYDNALPSGNAVMAENLWMAARLTDHSGYRQRALAMVERIAPVAMTYPRAFGHWLMLDQLLHGPEPELVCVESPTHWKGFSHAWNGGDPVWLPGLLYFHSGSTGRFVQLEGKSAPEHTTAWYSCTGQTCSLPMDHSREAVEKIIASY